MSKEIDLTPEAFILGGFLVVAALCIDFKVVVNVTDKPIINSAEKIVNHDIDGKLE